MEGFNIDELKGDLEKSLAEAEEKHNPTEVEDQEVEEKKTEGQPPATEGSGSEEEVGDPEVTQKEGEDQEGVEESENADSKEFPLIPNEWTAEEKEKFEDLLDNPETKEAAEVLINRYDNLKKGFYKKADELAHTKKNLSEFNDIFDPYRDALKQRGYTPASYVNRLVDVDRQLSVNPESVIKSLMEAYKVTPDKLGIGNEADDYYDNDEIAQLKKEIQELKTQGAKKTEDEGRSQQEAYAGIIRDFKFAVNEQGEPKYPLYEEVKEEMAILLQKNKANTLEEAYNLSPTVKEKTFEQQQEVKKQLELEEARKNARRAKKASRGVKPSAGSSSAASDSVDLGDMLSRAFREEGFV